MFLTPRVEDIVSNFWHRGQRGCASGFSILRGGGDGTEELPVGPRSQRGSEGCWGPRLRSAGSLDRGTRRRADKSPRFHLRNTCGRLVVPPDVSLLS